MMIRSVVGKLWLTIIGLVAVVLLILSLLMFQLFDRSFAEQQSEDLQILANKLAFIFENYEDRDKAISTASELVEAYDRGMVVVTGPDHTVVGNNQVNPRLPRISRNRLLQHPKLSQALDGEAQFTRETFIVENPMQEKDAKIKKEMMVSAVPLTFHNGRDGAVFLYQSLEELNETRTHAKKIILYAAGIGIFLTTIFAFFLSTRITQPLRQMKKAADRFGKGDFESHGQVQIRSHDEIGELSSTFNRMAQQLDHFVHALNHEKEHLYSILRSMADGVVTFDGEGNLILSNPPAQKMIHSWHYERERTPRNERAQNIAREDVPQPLATVFQTVLDSESEVVTDITVQGRTWSVIMDPLYDRKGIRGTVAVMRDMTEERRMDKLRKDFVANVSHELRTPISMLQGYGEALVDDVAGNAEERREIARIIYDESLRMRRLVNDLLDLARIESGHVELKTDDLDIEVFLKKLTRKFSALTKERNIDLHILGDIRGIVVPADEDRMEQVFTNLIDNAIRHTPNGGAVELTANEKKDMVNLHIHDTGSGIPKEDLPFVFERFYKANKARTRGKEGGTGLGLAIARNIVQAHGGTISVNSNFGEGTTFTIQLPKK